ncbi:MAG: polysaccharide deacetylase family protein [Acidobacteria bacterium]|nr:polysaccharide deacetylase family protein [Acidobacteriota bacterium]MBV9478439.1 polysaccharide deacetylase family protein [Acidobacteriota bacterium]
MTARRANLATILVLLSATAFAAPPSVPTPDLSGATVICYHIVEGPSAPRMLISRSAFRQHLQYLEMTGYNVIPLQHLYEYVMGKRASLPKNAVVLTFDDGWRSTYTEAFPELQKRKFPFTVFVYPKIIGQTANALTWKQIREMSDAGVDIQSHSLSHPYLTRRRHGSFNDTEYALWVQHELVESKRLLEKETGKTVSFLAYPYGDYDEKLTKAVAQAGYSAALTCDFGRVRRGSDPLRMRRFVIDDRMDFAAFRHYLGATPMQLADVTPAPTKPLDAGVTVISAKIPGYQQLDPKSVGMALLSLGSAIPYTYDPRSGSITLVLRDALDSMKARYHRAVVWGTDMKTGKRVEASWLLKFPTPPAPPAPPATTTPAAASTAAHVTVAAHGGTQK